MKISKRIAIMIMGFLFSLNLYAGVEQQHGLIMPAGDNPGQGICCIYLPTEGVTVYNAEGQVVGRLQRQMKASNDAVGLYQLHLVDNQGLTIELFEHVAEFFDEVSYEIWAMVFHDKREGFVKVLSEKSDYWLSLAELQQFKFVALPWAQFLLREQENLLGYYADDAGLNLRSAPNADAEHLLTIRGDLFEIRLTGESSGQWHKVEVIKSAEHFCSSGEEKIEYRKTGWIKLIDDNGAPNVSFYSRGC